MKLLFWMASFLILFSYAGYPLCLYLRARWGPRPARRAPTFPDVSIVLAVRNEEKYLKRKLDNLAALHYPSEHLELIVVSDGSLDQTNALLREWTGPDRIALMPQGHEGKANALNRGVAIARGEIICFTDARQMIEPEALRILVENFADRSVGCASGALMTGDPQRAQPTYGVGIYWRLEKNIRHWEALAGSTVGATGAFYAVRKNLLLPLVSGTILDDVLIPLQVARFGQRVVFDEVALAWDDFEPTIRQEFRRKVRTLLGNYQLLRLAPWLLTKANPLRFQFVCHKLLRLLVPFALLSVLFSTIWLRGGLYKFALASQMVLYGLAALAFLRTPNGSLARLSNISLTVVMLNTAAVVAFFYFITGKKGIWLR